MFYVILPSCSFLFFYVYFYYPSFFSELSLTFLSSLPPSIEKIVFDVVYNLIHIYSKIQIIINKIVVFISPISFYLQKFIMNTKMFNVNSLPNETNEILVFIYNGKEIFHCLKEEIDKKTKLFPEIFDFIIYSIKNEKDVIYKKIIYHFPLKLDDFHIEKLDYTFMLTELKLHHSIIKIDLRHYYLVNNKINATFLYYFFNKHKYFPTDSIDFKDFLENFSLKIIDDFVNIKEIFYLDELILNKSNFQITQVFNYTFENKISDSFITPSQEK